MFGKKCKNCNRKIGKDFDFCPYCGNNVKKETDEREFGLLGKEDGFNMDNFFQPTLGMTGLGKMFNSLLKQIDSQFKEMDKQMTEDKETKIKRFPASGISISISNSAGKEPEIKIRGLGNTEVKQIREAKITNEISDDEAKMLSKLPKKEAETKVRRLANKLIYELDLPGVKQIKDIIINKLENSIEIKAFSKDKAYFKLIPLNLPILKYDLKDGKLVLELKPSA